jgi:seryl-tRNA synthetase
MIEGYEPDAGSAVAGHRGYFLRDYGLLLNQALINYAMAFLRAKGMLLVSYVTRLLVAYLFALLSFALLLLSDNPLLSEYTLLSTPYFMNKAVMAKTAQLADFDEQLYKVIGEAGEEKYLIATSEQPISAFHMGQWIDPAKLPIRYESLLGCSLLR